MSWGIVLSKKSQRKGGDGVGNVQSCGVFVSPMKIVHDGVVLCWEWPNIWDTGNELLALLLCALSCSFTSETIFKPSLSQPCSHFDPSLQGGNATAKPQFQ